MIKENGLITIEDTRLVLRNFSGEEREFNKKGDRNFGILLSEEDAAALEAEGFNVKRFTPRDPEDPNDHGNPWMRIIARYDRFPPNVILIGSKNRTVLTEETIGQLDMARVEKVHITFRPRFWSRANGSSGYTAYLRTLLVYINEDYLTMKYLSDDISHNEVPFD